MARKICVFTGSRADYGLLAPLMRLIEADPRLELQVLVSGAHLEAEFGETKREIEADGFRIDRRVEMRLVGDRPVDLVRSMARCLGGCAEAFDSLKPDIVVLLGDRYEVLAAAEAAMLLRLPIAHIHGGEITEGAIDDAIRHAITKMAHLHFAATEIYRKRILQLGEQPDRVRSVGAIGLDKLAQFQPMSREAFASTTGFVFRPQNLLVSYHPVTLEEAPSASSGVEELLAALDHFDGAGVLITAANADAGGKTINEALRAWVARNRSRAMFTNSLGYRLYFSALSLFDALIGNSSSGIIEAPSLGCPTINIGSRQRGRLRAPSIIDCGPARSEIIGGIERALSAEWRRIADQRRNPYGSGNASATICEVLATANPDELLIKRFRDAA